MRAAERSENKANRSDTVIQREYRAFRGHGAGAADAVFSDSAIPPGFRKFVRGLRTGGSRSNFRIIQTGGTPFGAFPLFIFQYRRPSSALTPPQRKRSAPLSEITRRSFPKSRTPNSLPAISPPSPSEHRYPASAEIAASRIFASALSPPCRLMPCFRSVSDRRNSRCPGTRCGIFRPPPRPCPRRRSSSSTHPSCI